MPLEALLDDVFRRGCGISRAYALRTARYRDLQIELPHVTHTNAAEMAEMAYLGERLADRAFSNLPKKYRDAANRWSEMSDDERKTVLDQMMNELRSYVWAEARGQKVSRKPNKGEALPASYGSWTHGKMQPNCLGMVQMLIGFARATGAPHVMIDTLIQQDISAMRSTFMALEEILRITIPFAGHSRIRRVRKIILKYRQGLLSVLANAGERAMHHALAIKISDDWVVVDPYLKKHYALPAQWRKLLDRTSDGSAFPKVWAMYYPYNKLSAKQAIKAVEYAADALLDDQIGKDVDVTVLTSKMAVSLVHARHPYSELSELKKFEGDFVKLVGVLMDAYMISRYRAKLLDALSPEDLVVSLALWQKRNRRSRMWSFFRLLYISTLEAVVALSECTIDSEAQHPLIEASYPTVHLAVMTLNHVAGQRSLSAADLIRFDRSQALARDIIAEIDGGSNKLYPRILATRLRRWRKFPASMVMPEIRDYLDRKDPR